MTRQQAIRARCMDCSGGSYAEVKVCPLTECPLYPYRSRARGGKGSKAKAIYAYCLECCNGSAMERKLCPAKSCPLHNYRNVPAVRDSADAKSE